MALEYEEIVTNGPKRLADMLQAMRQFLGQNDMMAYLTMMAPRMVELHRVLKPTGSIYLHCDPTASHYLKLLMDAVFGQVNFRNELVWKRTSAHSDVAQGAKAIWVEFMTLFSGIRREPSPLGITVYVPYDQELH